MIFKIFINYLFGYLRICVEGYYIERFINICKSKKIFLWNMQRQRASIIHINIGIQDFKKIRTIAKKTGCKISIQKKRGFPFIINRYKKRKIFIGALIFIIFVIVILSRFIWNIEIIGNEKINADEIMEIINNSGLNIGKYKTSINTKEIVNEIRLKREDIAWVGINIEGTNAIVQIVEADEKPTIVNDEEYCNIIAKKEGIIEKIIANNGTIKVKEGDIVTKDTVLIAGWMEGKYTGNRFVHASGNVIAKVWYSQNIKMNLKEKIKEKTGNVETKYGISLNNFVINFYKRLSNFEKYDTMYKNEKIKIFSNFYIPVEIIQYDNYEITYKDVEYTIEEAKEKAKTIAENKLLEQIENKENIKNVTVNYKESEDYVEVEVIYEVLEDIGTEEKIVF